MKNYIIISIKEYDFQKKVWQTYKTDKAIHKGTPLLKQEKVTRVQRILTICS